MEVNGPYKAASLSLKQGTIQKFINFAVVEENRITLKVNHMYYFQMQGNLKLQKLLMFIIWTPCKD